MPRRPTACHRDKGPNHTPAPIWTDALSARAHTPTMTDTDCRPAERFEQLVRIWRALSPTRQSRWTGRVLAGNPTGLMDRIAIAAAMPSVPVPLGSLGLDFRRFTSRRLKHRDRARRLAADALSYRAGAGASPRSNMFRTGLIEEIGTESDANTALERRDRGSRSACATAEPTS
jgi:hypothetical protein